MNYIFEKNIKVAKKILASGNGRCNISNANLSIQRGERLIHKYEEKLHFIESMTHTNDLTTHPFASHIQSKLDWNESWGDLAENTKESYRRHILAFEDWFLSANKKVRELKDP